MVVKEQSAFGIGAALLAGGRDEWGGPPSPGEGGHLPLVSQEQLVGTTCEMLPFILVSCYL